MTDFDYKVLTFLSHISNAYKNEEEYEYPSKLKLEEEKLTEDFTAMIKALFILYQRITEDNTDFLGFSHIVNRLIVQHILPSKEKE